MCKNSHEITNDDQCENATRTTVHGVIIYNTIQVSIISKSMPILAYDLSCHLVNATLVLPPLQLLKLTTAQGSFGPYTVFSFNI